MPIYPEVIFNPTPKQDGDSVNAAFFNDRDGEINAIEKVLGAELIPHTMPPDGDVNSLAHFLKVVLSSGNYCLVLVPQGAVAVLGAGERLHWGDPLYVAPPAGTKLELSDGTPGAGKGVRFVLGEYGSLTLENSYENGDINVDPNRTLGLGTARADYIFLGRLDEQYHYNTPITAQGKVTVRPGGQDIPDAFQVTKHDGTTAVLKVDTVNSRVGVEGAAELAEISNTGQPAAGHARLFLRHATDPDRQELVVQFANGTTKVLQNSL